MHAVGIRGVCGWHPGVYADGIQGACGRHPGCMHINFHFFINHHHPTTEPPFNIDMKRQSQNNEEGNGTGKRQRRDDEIKDTIQTYIDRLEDNRCVKTIEFVAFDICATPMDVCDILPQTCTARRALGGMLNTARGHRVCPIVETVLRAIELDVVTSPMYYADMYAHRVGKQADRIAAAMLKLFSPPCDVWTVRKYSYPAYIVTHLLAPNIRLATIVGLKNSIQAADIEVDPRIRFAVHQLDAVIKRRYAKNTLFVILKRSQSAAMAHIILEHVNMF